MLMEILRQESDQNHPLKTVVLCKKLLKLGIKCDRRTLSDDIDVLRDFGFNIGARMIGHEKGYFYDVKSFSVAELKIMIDAIQAASFVTQKKADDLVERIAQMGGTRKRDILKNNIVCFRTRRHSNEGIYDNIENLEEAIHAKRQASFYYFDRDEKGNIVYRKDKKRYIVEPMALIYNEDNYYLLCYSSKYDGMTTYRVDRIEDVEIENDRVSEKAMMDMSDIANYSDQAFKMYGGPATDITLEFDDNLIGVIYDRFGEQTSIVRTAPNKCVASVCPQISPTFWGWFFQFGEKMRILSPQSVIEDYKDMLRRLLDNAMKV